MDRIGDFGVPRSPSIQPLPRRVDEEGISTTTTHIPTDELTIEKREAKKIQVLSASRLTNYRMVMAIGFVVKTVCLSLCVSVRVNI